MLPLSWIDELFKRFEAMYGNQFRQKWEGCDIAMIKNEWAEALSGMDGETIKRALDACRANNPFPPSSPEFYQLCRQFRVHAHQKNLALPKYLTAEEKEKGRKNLEKIKEMLGGSALMKRMEEQNGQ